MCKEVPVIPVNRVVDKKGIIRKNGGPRRRRGKRGRRPTKKDFLKHRRLRIRKKCIIFLSSYHPIP
jgi:hypothetical protein